MLTRSVQIHYMLSFSRSGETLVQRHMSACDDLTVGYDLFSKDDENEIRRKKYLMRKSVAELDSEVATKLGVTTSHMLAKCIWLHKGRRQDFILVRHPLSIVASIAAKYNQNNAAKFSAKLGRICSYVHPRYGNAMQDETSMDAIALKVAHAWAHRMRVAYRSGAPIVHYERFVSDHASMLERLCSHMNIGFGPNVENAQRNFADQKVGHGGLVLSSPVDPERAFSNHKHLSKSQTDMISYVCAETMDLYGYSGETGSGMLDSLCPDRFQATAR